ncbi:MAG: conjugal transfer protein TraX [Patescibacteria group bacterium]|nr:conjugal transfer protein TraX [Patescibacteria group bacterium]
MVEKSNEQRPNLYDYLKIIALIAMLIDHIGYYLLPECLWLRVV